MASSSTLYTLLREAAPQLSKRLFPTRQCRRRAFTGASLPFSHQTPSAIVKASPSLRAFRQASNGLASPSRAFRPSSTISRIPSSPPARTILPARSMNATGDGKGSHSFPETSSKSVAWWLFGSAASVYAIVVLGGLTRLTESGITEWRPVTGSIPPLSGAEWDVEFDKYRASPEFQLLNPNMSLSEFKEIFWMEYAHRLLGRAIGLGVFLPTVYFIAKRRVTLPMARNLLLINCLIGFQGFIGWWMVKSGLKDDLFAKGSHPRVSQYRLAAHLGLAFTVYSSMLWNGLSIMRDIQHTIKPITSQGPALLRRPVIALGGLVFLTVLSGALVAGLDAGLIYNEFPYMGNGFAPPASELWSPFYSREPPPHRDLWWRNMFENPSLVQLDHRILAVTTFTLVNTLFCYARFWPGVYAAMSKPAQTALLATTGLVWLQATLGITTLWYLVPKPLAAAHQAGSLALLTGFIVLASRLGVRIPSFSAVRGQWLQLRSQMKQRAAFKDAEKQATLKTLQSLSGKNLHSASAALRNRSR